MQLSWNTVRQLAEGGDEQAADYLEFTHANALRYTHYVKSIDGKLYLCSYAHGLPRDWLREGG